MTDKITRKPFKHKIALDVDGVLNSYGSGWKGAEAMPDPPNRGAMPFLRELVDDGRFEAIIVSSRLNHDNGQQAVVNWLRFHLISELGRSEGERVFGEIGFSRIRPPASVTLDDRAVTFMGEWPSMDRLAAFQPFYKKSAGLRPDPETAVAQVDALMTRIGSVAQETGCPSGTPALVWLEELARIGHAVASDATATIEKLSDEDMERIQALPLQPGAVLALPPSSWSMSGDRLRTMLEAAWDLGAGTAYARRDRSADYEADGKTDEAIRQLDVGRLLEKAEKERDAAARLTIDSVPVMSVNDLPEPETLEIWTVDAPPSLSHVVTRQRLFHESDETGEPRKLGDDGKVEAIRQRQACLNAAFAPYAHIEALIVDAVPPGTPVSRASAGGDLGWRIGWGWMSVEGIDAARPDSIRGCAQSLAAIPGMSWEKPRNRDPELVARTLQAGRAM